MLGAAGQQGQFSTLVFNKTCDRSTESLTSTSKSPLWRQSEHVEHGRPGNVGIDQHDRIVQFHGDAHRQIDGGEALALSGKALVTMMRLPLATGAAPLPMALAIKGA